ncbi:hypothetical protein ACP70R_008717 [Stipagrostis hirtigluma subsp. patula]
MNQEAPAAVGEVKMAALAAEKVKMAALEEEEKKKRTKVVRVKVEQNYMDWLLKLYPRPPFPVVREESIRGLTPEQREAFLALMADCAAATKQTRQEQEAILEQYRSKGYAEKEVVVTDDEEDDDDGGCVSGDEAEGTVAGGDAAVHVGVCKL